MTRRGISYGSAVLGTIASLDPMAQAAVLIRHSVRGSIEEEGPDAPLTVEGCEYARGFGAHLPWGNSVMVRYSPRKRCVQTAQEIVEGFHQTNPDAEAILLGSQESVSTILHSTTNKSNLQTLLQRIQEGALPGSDDKWNIPPELVDFGESAARDVLRTIGEIVSRSKGGSLHLFVDHDLHLIVLREYLFGTRFSRRDWIDYMDGFVLVFQKDGSFVAHVEGLPPRYGTLASV